MSTPAPSSAVLDELKAALGPGGWTQDPEVVAPYLTEWRNRWTGETPLLLTPRSTEEVARAVTICAREDVAITPQGGGTGLVGGQIPFGEVLLSLKKMRATRDVTPLDDAMTVEAGLTLLEAQQAATAAGKSAQAAEGDQTRARIAAVRRLIAEGAAGRAALRQCLQRTPNLG